MGVHRLVEAEEASVVVEAVDKLTIDNNQYNIIIKKKRIKNTYIRIDENLDIIVTTNALVPKIYINKLINDNIKSITKMLNTRIKKNKTEKLNENEYIIFGTKNYIIINDSIKKIEIKGNIIEAKSIKEVNIYLNKIFRERVEERVKYYINMFKEELPDTRIRVRKMKTRWGVCNYKDNIITLNITLINYPYECLDYVIVHELSHYIYHDHSKKFWSLVEKYMPDYKKIRKKLKESDEDV